MRFGLGSGLGAGQSSGGLTIVRDGLVMQHKYNASAVQPLSDGAACFTGGDLINLATNRTMDTDGNCCFMFWAKRTEVSSEDAVVGNTGNSGNKIVRFNDNTTMSLESEENDEAVITLHSPNDFEWHHYAIVCTSGTVTAFQDGASCSVSAPDIGSNTTFNVIGGAGGGKSYEGYLCNLGLWSNSFTQAQIKNLMWKSFTDLTEDEKNLGLIHWYDLSENANDSQGGNNGSVGP
jgi:hypothetical protein